ncbi:hypothetical protein [Nostoc sp. PA-18-2419]|uniref:hypothetical protein n=1 Tax=Nostoc sp. PA-18-2419 TaxID=2575443 RepID=UPI001CB89E28|nr:hypothetical protein [Nostoc sp. PA-18-2419]
MCILKNKIICITVNSIATLTAFFINSKAVLGNVYFDKLVTKELNYTTTNKKIFVEKFSTKASDLLTSPESDMSHIELLKNLLSVFGNTNIEIGEYSCYSGNLVTYEYLNNKPIGAFMLSIYTPTQGRRTVNLDSSETILPKYFCDEIINGGYKLIYKERQLDIKIRELKVNLYMHKPVYNFDLERNIQNTWNVLIENN